MDYTSYEIAWPLTGSDPAKARIFDRDCGLRCHICSTDVAGQIDRRNRNCPSLRMLFGEIIGDDSRQCSVIGRDNIKLGPSIGLTSIHNFGTYTGIQVDK